MAKVSGVRALARGEGGGDLVRTRRFSMSELVERVQVPPATVRYYLAQGLLPPPMKLSANRFLYDERHVEIVRLIRLFRARRGLSLEAIRALLPELLPDLAGVPVETSFRPEMWQALLATRANGDQRDVRTRLIDAGLEAFARHGYADVAIDDVCRAASIAKGSFYRHFASKEELFFAVAALASARGAAELATAPPDEPLLEQVASAVEPGLTIVLDLASLASRRSPGHARALRAYLGALRDALAPRLPELNEDEVVELVEVGVARAVRRATRDAGGFVGT